ncbi:MAG: type II secretion system protein GspM [Gammaproteobacteria bacterium]
MVKLPEKIPGRWIAVFLLAAVSLVLLSILIFPAVGKGLEYNDEKKDLVFRLQRFNRIVASKDLVYDSIGDSRERFESQGYFSNQQTEALASAELQKFLKKVISSAGGQMTSTQVLPKKVEEHFIRISVRVRMASDIEVLRSVLYEIESSTPLLLIEQLDIRPVRGRRNRLTRKVEPSSQLNVNFQVAGFMRKVSG